MKTKLIIALIVSLHLLFVHEDSVAHGRDGDLSRLLDEVSSISSPGVPGPFCVFGDEAFAVVPAKMGRGIRAAVVASSRMGRGRVVAFGHTGYFGSGSLVQGDTARLVANAIQWVSGKERKGGLRVAIHGHPDLTVLCREEKHLPTLLKGAEWTKKLRGFDVLCIGTHALTKKEDQEAVAGFLRKGGGLIAGGLAWGWLQLNPGKRLQDHPGNRLLAPAGLVWADGYAQDTADGGFLIEKDSLDAMHAGRALQVLEAHGIGKKELGENELRQAVWIVTHASRSIPPQDKLLLFRLRRIQREHFDDALPMPQAPLDYAEPLARLALTLQLEEMKSLPPERIKPHPAAEIFPGPVPKEARRVTERLKIDTSVPGWHSTGLYAPPGRLIRVQAPGEAMNKGLKVRIGAHSDALWHLDGWKRCPDICRVVSVDAPWTSTANAFGGLIYIEVPGGCSLGEAVLMICNAVAAPHYVLGENDLEEWRNTIRLRPAPWAELAGRRVILTLSSEHVRGLEDPEALMTFWDKVLDAIAALAARPLERERAERFVTDVQISAGYMHSGYPIMTHLDIGEVIVDKDRIMAKGHGGVWGLFHELGHNHQSGDWTFSGTGEVTCNLFTLYVFDQCCGMAPEEHDSFSQEARKKKIENYLLGGADFNQWKGDPFLALLMYIQLQEAFGWDIYKAVFAEYRDLSPSRRPKTDDEKRDQWMVRFSRKAGKNLGPFFDAWGVPVSKEAKQSVQDLPEWMPEGFPPESRAAEKGSQ